MLRILDRLADTPAEIVTELGETLRQTPPAVALLGDGTRYTGSRAQHRLPLVHRPRHPATSTRPRTTSSSPACTPPASAASPRRAGPGSRAAHLAELLLEQSKEFRTLWADHEIGIEPDEVKRFQHPEVGRLDLNCQVLFDPHQSHRLMVYTADPGTESYEKLQLLTVIGAQRVSSS